MGFAVGQEDKMLCMKKYLHLFIIFLFTGLHMLYFLGILPLPSWELRLVFFGCTLLGGIFFLRLVKGLPSNGPLPLVTLVVLLFGPYPLFYALKIVPSLPEWTLFAWILAGFALPILYFVYETFFLESKWFEISNIYHDRFAVAKGAGKGAYKITTTEYLFKDIERCIVSVEGDDGVEFFADLEIYFKDNMHEMIALSLRHQTESGKVAHDKIGKEALEKLAAYGVTGITKDYSVDWGTSSFGI